MNILFILTLVVSLCGAGASASAAPLSNEPDRSYTIVLKDGYVDVTEEECDSILSSDVAIQPLETLLLPNPDILPFTIENDIQPFSLYTLTSHVLKPGQAMECFKENGGRFYATEDQHFRFTLRHGGFWGVLSVRINYGLRGTMKRNIARDVSSGSAVIFDELVRGFYTIALQNIDMKDAELNGTIQIAP